MKLVAWFRDRKREKERIRERKREGWRLRKEKSYKFYLIYEVPEVFAGFAP